MKSRETSVCAMEPSRTTSSTVQLPKGYLLFLILGTTIWSTAVNAYISRPSQISIPTTVSSEISTRIIADAVERNIVFDEKNRLTRLRSLRLYSSERSDSEDDSESTNDESNLSAPIAIANVTAGAQFGDVTPMQPNSATTTSAQFGDVVPISRPSSSPSSPSLFEDATSQKKTSDKKPSGLSDVELLKQRKTRNIAVAILSIALAVGNYAYQWTHPVTPIQLLVNMERSSAPLSEIGKNSKPTVIDFWAPW